jgi:PAS domain S-box-containing protein
MTQALKPSPLLNRQVVQEIFNGVAAVTGEAFFDALVKHLARALHVKCAWVTEWLEEEGKLRALSFWVDGRYVLDYEYAIAGTPCEGVITDQCLVVVSERVVELFPGDPDLAPLGAVSYMGQPLLDADGKMLGNLAVLHDRPLQSDATCQAVFSIFGARAAAELGRVRRDRVLREREEKLSCLINSAMDSIIEIDVALKVTHLNQAGADCFRCDGAAMVGKPLRGFFTPVTWGRLLYLTKLLASDSFTACSLWVPDPLEGQRTDGSRFLAEATLSHFEVNGHTYFTLILRNVEDRIAAEARIRALADEAAALRAELDSVKGFDEIIGTSPPMRRLLLDLDRVAPTEATVLITGETGTGKELVANAIHRRSSRCQGPLIKVNCAAIAANLQESEFFGHEKGAFTGATYRREGRFKLADKGTLFLDEVGEMPLDLQAKLLRVLQEGEYEPVGSATVIKTDVRVIAATNRDLTQMVRTGAFRQDLLYRLNVFPLRVPPLRERDEDILPLAEAFAERLARQRGIKMAPLGPEARARLQAYSWPGNIRELENVIERAWITSTDGRTLNLARALPEAEIPQRSEPLLSQAVAEKDLDQILTATEFLELERANLRRALEAAGWKLSGQDGAAHLLGLHPNTLASRMKSLGIQRPPKSRTKSKVKFHETS